MPRTSARAMCIPILLSVTLLSGCSRVTEPVISYRTTIDFGGVWGTSATDVYAYGLGGRIPDWEGVLMHYDGRQWTREVVGQTSITGMWHDAENRQFLVGFKPYDIGSLTRRTFDGSRWTEDTQHVSTELFGLWANSASDVFAVGNGRLYSLGAIMHFDGAQWTTQVDTLGMRHVWGSSGRDVFAVGEGIVHYDGAKWSQQLDVHHFFGGVWGTSGTDVFAVGSGVWHYDGSQWVQLKSGGNGGILTGVWGSSSNNVFVVGYGGTILHFDGNTWTTQTSGTPQDLQGVWGSGPSDVYAVGYEGAIVHFNGNRWSAVDLTPVRFPSPNAPRRR